MKIIAEPAPPFAERRFLVELTGHELAHIWRLSYSEEAGTKFPSVEDRICEKIGRGLDPETNLELSAYARAKNFSQEGPAA